jgi:hypothetical protein
MVDQILIMGVMAAYLFYIIRTVVILLGWLKGVALHTFEQYGDERRFRPVADLVFLVVILLMLLPFLPLPQDLTALRFIAFFLGGAMLIGGMYTFQDVLAALLAKLSPKIGEQYLALTAYYPTWYRDLATRTSRYERRRIAYMWLRLTPNQRHLLDRDTSTFLHWTDFVIMGSVMEEDIGTKSIPKTYERGYFH